MSETRSSDPSVLSISDPSRPYDLAVVGAGIAGLSAALTAASAGRRVLVLDAHPAGGRARTTDRDGYLHNLGPHALYRTGALAALLGRHHIPVTGGVPLAIGALAVRGGTAHPLPARPFELLRTRLLGRTDRLRLLALLARVQRTDPARWVGRPVSELAGGTSDRVCEFLEMFVRVSTYTDAPETLDAGAAITQMQMALGAGVRYLDGGWASMIAAMVHAVEAGGGAVHTGMTVRSVAVPGGDEPLTLTTDAGFVFADAVVIAAGGPDVAQRLTGAAVRGADRITPPVTATVLDLALRTEQPALAFALDAPLYLSAHAPAARLAPQGRGLVSVMRYHAPSADIGDSTENRAELRGFAGQAGVTAGDVVHEHYLHRLVVTHGAPTAEGGGLPGRPAVDALDLPGVYLAGDWVGSEGLLADAAASSGVVAAQRSVRCRASISG